MPKKKLQTKIARIEETNPKKCQTHIKYITFVLCLGVILVCFFLFHHVGFMSCFSSHCSSFKKMLYVWYVLLLSRVVHKAFDILSPTLWSTTLQHLACLFLFVFSECFWALSSFGLRLRPTMTLLSQQELVLFVPCCFCCFLYFLGLFFLLLLSILLLSCFHHEALF